jgi:hypothetical protein
LSEKLGLVWYSFVTCTGFNPGIQAGDGVSSLDLLSNPTVGLGELESKVDTHSTFFLELSFVHFYTV